jgi:hypothetical protein
VNLISTQRSKEKIAAIRMKSIERAGLEDLTISFQVQGHEPIDRQGLTDGGYCGDCFQNDPHGLDDLYIQLVVIADSQNCWVDNCSIYSSGTEPVVLAGSHNTVRNCLIDRAFNKGGGGNGYFDLRGDYNLAVGNTVRRIRHFAIQQGAKFNVVYRNRLEVDVNFHNKDDGHNLVEGNEILLPTWHTWNIFSTGGAKYGHQPPGEKNMLYNNQTNYRNQGPRFAGGDVVYTFTGFGDPVDSGVKPPKRRTFYPLKRARVAAAKPTDPPPAEHRTWISADGKFQIVAKLVEKNADTVRLERNDDSRVITVPIDSLGEADRAYLRDR